MKVNYSYLGLSAVVLALGAVAEPASSKVVNITAYYQVPGVCLQGQVCDPCTLTIPTGNIRCKIIGRSDLAFRDTNAFGTICSVPIYRKPDSICNQ